MQRQQWLDGFAGSGRYQCLVVVKGGAVIGWASSHRFRERAAYDTTVETSVYLAPNQTGQGVGRLLYTALFEALKGQDIHRFYGGITQPNAASNRLHERMGFQRVGLVPQVGRKFGRFWDVATDIRAMSPEGGLEP